MCSVIDGSIALQYVLELQIIGMEDGRHQSIPIYQCLERLSNYQVARERFQWTLDREIQTDAGTLVHHATKISHGILLLKSPAHYILNILPSPLREIPQSSRILPSHLLEEETHPFIDISQDLLVQFKTFGLRVPVSTQNISLELESTCSLRFFSLSSGRAHPRAFVPVIEWTDRPVRPSKVKIDVYGSLIAVDSASFTNLRIYDWIKGSLKLEAVSILMIIFLCISPDLISGLEITTD
jgi:hypothetical protein